MCSVCSKHSYSCPHLAHICFCVFYTALRARLLVWWGYTRCFGKRISPPFPARCSNLSTAPGGTCKPSVTITWSKAEHSVLSWDCSRNIFLSGEGPSSLVSCCYRLGYGSPVLATVKHCKLFCYQPYWTETASQSITLSETTLLNKYKKWALIVIANCLL